MSQYFGFELLYNSVKNDLKEKSDLIVVVFHWFLIRENFQCLGVGTERDLLDTDNPSELLPTGWNDNQETFYLRYFNSELKKIFILDVTMASPLEAVITIAGDDEVTKGFTLNIQDYLADYDVAAKSKTKIQHIMPKIDELMYKFQSLFKQLIPVDTKEATAEGEGRTHPGTAPSVANPLPFPGSILDSIAPFLNVGRGDLDPFNAGGGMLAIGPRVLPRVRYDPVGPIPSHDHFPPPGGPGFGQDPDDLLNLRPNRPSRNIFGPPGPGGAGNFDWYG